MHDPAEGVSPGGTIVTGARRSQVAPAFEPVLTAVGDELAVLVGEVSLYLYGSVATGAARVGTSDVDFVTVGLSPDIAAAISRSVSAQFAGLCRGVEIAPAQPSDLERDDDEAHGMRAFLRHYCVHLHGPDPRADLPDVLADARAARGFNGDLSQHLSRWRASLDSGQPAPVLGRSVARKTLLAVAGLVSVRDATWTTDREGAARRWSVLEPDLAGPLGSLVAWSEGRAHPGDAALRAALAPGGVVDRVTRSFESSIGLWTAPTV